MTTSPQATEANPIPTPSTTKTKETTQKINNRTSITQETETTTPKVGEKRERPCLPGEVGRIPVACGGGFQLTSGLNKPTSYLDK